MSPTTKDIVAARLRSALKGLYYSRPVRAVAYAPAEAFDVISGRRQPMTPPRRLQYVGRSADFEAVGAWWRDLLVDRHGLEPDGDVLDIGCGIGRNAVALVPYLTEGTYEGFDVVPQFIRWCRRKITPSHPNFNFQVAEVRNRQYNPTAGSPAAEYAFPYAAGSFDLAWAASVFSHMRPNEINRYLSEAYRVLRPGGQLVCTFFVVDPTAIDLIGRGSSAFRLDHRISDDEGTPFLAADERVPEYCIGVHEENLAAMVEAIGFETIGGIEHGWWSGRHTAGGPAGYQDRLALRKPG